MSGGKRRARSPARPKVLAGFRSDERAVFRRLLPAVDSRLIETFEQMRDYCHSRRLPQKERLTEKEGRKAATRITATGRKFLDALGAVDPIGWKLLEDIGKMTDPGEPTGAMRLVWQRGGDHQDVLAAERAVRRVLDLLRPVKGRSGRTSNAERLRIVIRDLAAIYLRQTGKRPTSSGPFADLVRAVIGRDDVKDEIAAALSRKPRAKS